MPSTLAIIYGRMNVRVRLSKLYISPNTTIEKTKTKERPKMTSTEQITTLLLSNSFPLEESCWHILTTFPTYGRSIAIQQSNIHVYEMDRKSTKETDTQDGQ